MNDKKEARKIFEKYGEIFVKLQEKDKNRHYLSEIIHKMMGKVKGKKILDAGCGAGFDSKIMAKKGAEVIGIDISPNMLKMAKKKCKGLNIKFYLRDMEKTGFPNGHFDIVAAIFCVALKRNLRKVLKEFYRVLKKGGELFLVDVHPIRKMVVYTGDYFETGKHWEISRGWKRFEYYRKIEDLLNTSISAGFTLKEIREPKPKVKKEERFYPHYMILKLEKK